MIKAVGVWGGLVVLIMIAMVGEREWRLANSERVFLKLAPVDPRSMMQGDYMQLAYEIEQTAQSKVVTTGSILLVIRLNESGVGELVRVEDGTPPTDQERLLRAEVLSGFADEFRVSLGLETYFFQEGTAAQYEDATHGEIRLSSDGTAILTGLIKLEEDEPEPR